MRTSTKRDRRSIPVPRGRCSCSRTAGRPRSRSPCAGRGVNSSPTAASRSRAFSQRLMRSRRHIRQTPSAEREKEQLMPGLLRGIARTAAVAGTATAVSNRVSRRQANRWAQQEPQYEQQPAYAPPPPPPPAPVEDSPDPIEQLRQLGELHAQGALTDEEFAVEKSKILGRRCPPAQPAAAATAPSRRPLLVMSRLARLVVSLLILTAAVYVGVWIAP